MSSPQAASSSAASAAGGGWRRSGRPEGIWALPKGNVGPDESPEATAVREVAEETGIDAVSTGKLGDVRYVYTRDGQRIFKIVSFFLLRYRRGRIGDLPSKFRHEVDDVRWLPLEEAPRLLTYKGEREMAQKALAALDGEAV